MTSQNSTPEKDFPNSRRQLSYPENSLERIITEVQVSEFEIIYFV